MVKWECPDCNPGDSECERCGEWCDTEFGRLQIPTGKPSVIAYWLGKPLQFVKDHEQ